MSVGGAIKARIAFKRMERDAELIARCRAAGHTAIGFADSAALDVWAWDKAKLQRRIVEDEA